MLRKNHVLGLIPLLVLMGALAGREIGRGGVVTTDTLNLLDSTAGLDLCLDRGDLSCDEMGRWPPLQYIPALVFKRLGASFVDAANDLIYLNGLAVMAVLALLWVAGRRSGAPWLAPLAILAGLVSPLLWYGAAGFAEAVAASLTLLFVVAVALGWNPWLAGGALWAAALSKETALPFLVALGVIALLLRPRDDPRRRPLAIALGAGAAAAALTIGLVNLSRYGVPWNRYYVDPDWAVHGLGWRADFFAAQLVSPNAGLLWFWPLATAAVAAAGAGALRHARRARTLRGRPGLVLATVAVLAGLIATFASWWAPFGWVAYGPRLIVPWVPAVLALVLLAWGEQLGSLTRALLARPGRAVAVGVVALALGLPQLGAFLDPPRPLRNLEEAGVCPPVPDVLARIRAGDPEANRGHNVCTARFAWLHRPMMRDALRGIRGTRWLYAALYAAAVAGLVITARSATARSSLRSPRHGS
jgi:hypothetical protein